jgi:hypothetical protein
MITTQKSELPDAGTAEGLRKCSGHGERRSANLYGGLGPLEKSSGHCRNGR